MAQAPKKPAKGELVAVRALRNLEVDGAFVAEGEVAEIRSELVASLVAAGAVDDEVTG